MAIKKQIELPNGAIGEYWRISYITTIIDHSLEAISPIILNSRIDVDLFKNENYRENKLPIFSTSFITPIVKSIGEAYIELKKLDYFIDGEDC